MASPDQPSDVDPAETAEWLEALEAVVEHDGPERARELLERLYADARLRGLHPAGDLSTPYVNTIPVSLEPEMPGDPELEHRVRSLIRWNAIALILRANKESSELGGHIASFQSAATLYEVGFNHFWHAPTEEHGGDLVLFQGHSSPGIYAAAFLEGRFTEEQMLRFRTEALAPGCRRIRTRGSCRSSGSSRRCRWASARSWRSTRRGS
jgi:pyruvate dehydrogenase E1 component